jgi:hypothetical protein
MEAGLLKLLVLLAGLTMGCGVAIGLTESLAPGQTDDRVGY